MGDYTGAYLNRMIPKMGAGTTKGESTGSAHCQRVTWWNSVTKGLLETEQCMQQGGSELMVLLSLIHLLSIHGSSRL